MGLPSKMARNLQLMQNAATQVVMGVRRFDSTGSLLQQLQWMPIHFWSQFKVLVLTSEVLHSLGLGYLKNCILPHIPAHPLRFSEQALLQVLPLEQVNWIPRKSKCRYFIC